MPTPEQWVGKLAALKVDKARGDPAPHKPLLLLVVLEVAEQAHAFGDILPQSQGAEGFFPQFYESMEDA
jgi:hypothetical protein